MNSFTEKYDLYRGLSLKVSNLSSELEDYQNKCELLMSELESEFSKKFFSMTENIDAKMIINNSVISLHYSDQNILLFLKNHLENIYDTVDKHIYCMDFMIKFYNEEVVISSNLDLFIQSSQVYNLKISNINQALELSKQNLEKQFEKLEKIFK